MTKPPPSISENRSSLRTTLTSAFMLRCMSGGDLMSATGCTNVPRARTRCVGAKVSCESVPIGT